MYKLATLGFFLLWLFGCRNEEEPDVSPTAASAASQPTSTVAPMATATYASTARQTLLPTAMPPAETPTPTTMAAPSAMATVADVSALTPPYEYLKLEELSISAELQYVAWKTDGLELIYALIRPEARSAEPKDWAWWRYDLETRQKEPLPPPESRVTEEVRRRLDLCPTDQEPLERRPDCPDHSILLESTTSDRIVFSPLGSHGDDTWLGDIDGTNQVKLETPVESPSYAQWSPDGSWLLLSVHFPGMPGQMTHYLIRDDGSYETEFSALTSHDLFRLSGLFPRFSPNGTELAYVGSTNYESFNAGDYHLYLLDLESMESHLVSNRIGLFQWSADGNGLYVLDGGLYPVDPYEDVSGERKTDLFYIDVTSLPAAETLIGRDIAYVPRNSFGSWLGEYSPLAQALAYAGYEPNEFGVLLLAPAK